MFVEKNKKKKKNARKPSRQNISSSMQERLQLTLTSKKQRQMLHTVVFLTVMLETAARRGDDHPNSLDMYEPASYFNDERGSTVLLMLFIFNSMSKTELSTN